MSSHWPVILMYPTVTTSRPSLHWNQTLKEKGTKWERSLESVCRKYLPLIDPRLETYRQTWTDSRDFIILCLCQDGLNAHINYYAIIGSVWRSVDIHYLCERVINNAKNPTKLEKSGYLSFPFPCWQDQQLSVVRRSVKCAGSRCSWRTSTARCPWR